MFDNIKDNESVFVPAIMVWGIIVMTVSLCILWFFDSLYMDAMLTYFADGCYAFGLYLEGLV